MSKKFSKILEDSGIIREQTAPYSQEQNRVAERTNRTIVAQAKATLFAAGLSDGLWGETVHTTIYWKNRSPMSALTKCVTPLEQFS